MAAYSDAEPADCWTFLLITAILSIGLGLFNLVPIPPLDGSKVLFCSCCRTGPTTSMLRYERYGMLRAVGVGAAGRGAAARMSAAIQWVLMIYSAAWSAFKRVQAIG